MTDILELADAREPWINIILLRKYYHWFCTVYYWSNVEL